MGAVYLIWRLSLYASVGLMLTFLIDLIIYKKSDTNKLYLLTSKKKKDKEVL